MHACMHAQPADDIGAGEVPERASASFAQVAPTSAGGDKKLDYKGGKDKDKKKGKGKR